ncbi:MAG: DUF2244 domain-containing protein [Rhodopila sp.]
MAGALPGNVPYCGPEPVFEAVIAPHQSLNRRGLLVLAGSVGGISLLVSLRFLLLGAWPVMAFSVIEVSLALILLMMHRRQALRREIIRLDETAITVVRTDSKGRRFSFSLPAAWLQVRLETIAGGQGSRLWLRSHGRGWEVGAFLHDPERQSLAEALREAVYGLRNPRFNNEQLLEC